MYYISRFVSIVVHPMQIIIGWMVRLVPGFRRLANLSLPARCAVMAFVFLLMLLGVGILYQMFGGGDQRLPTNWRVFLSVLIALTILTPIPVYLLVKLLMQRPESPFPEIERAWNWGMSALESQQIDIKNTPLFLVVGAEGRQHAARLMQAARIGSSVEPPHGENHAIQWFASSSAIFLFADDCSCVSALAKKRRRGTPLPAIAEMDLSAAGATVDASQIDAAQFAAGAHATAHSHLGAAGPSREAVFTTAGAGFPDLAVGAGATMQVDVDSPLHQQIRAAGAPPVVPRVSSDENEYAVSKMAFLCELIRKVRGPVCEINGLLVTVPFDLIESGESDVLTAARKDMQALRENLRVRCAVNVLVSEMEEQDGFQELVNRVGESYAREMRFGKGCKEWGDPTVTRVRAVAHHATGAFEDWTYTIFKNPETLRRKYNTRLVSLLCRTRGKFARSLESFLSSVFGYDPQRDRQSARDQFLFSGCYFAATGTDEESQAFVRGVFTKLIDQQADLEWSTRAVEDEQHLQTTANFVAFVGFLALMAILGGLGYQAYQYYGDADDPTGITAPLAP